MEKYKGAFNTEFELDTVEDLLGENHATIYNVAYCLDSLNKNMSIRRLCVDTRVAYNMANTYYGEGNFRMNEEEKYYLKLADKRDEASYALEEMLREEELSPDDLEQILQIYERAYVHEFGSLKGINRDISLIEGLNDKFDIETAMAHTDLATVLNNLVNKIDQPISKTIGQKKV